VIGAAIVCAGLLCRRPLGQHPGGATAHAADPACSRLPVSRLPRPVGALGRLLLGVVILAVLLLIALLVLSQKGTESSPTTTTRTAR